MNSLADLITRCLGGTASTVEWQSLDERIATDPGAAVLWIREVRLHRDLEELLAPREAWRGTRRRAGWRRVVMGTAVLAAAAMVALVIHFGWSRGEEEEPRIARISSEERSMPGSSAEGAAEVSGGGHDGSGDAMPGDGAEKIMEGSGIADGAGQNGPGPADTREDAADEAPALRRVETQEKVLALRFSDGPREFDTPRLLDILKEEGVHATFFCMGTNVQKHPEICRRMIAEGHEIGNHTWSHPMLAKAGDEVFREEVKKCQDEIRRQTGIAPMLFEPPFGAVTAHQRELVRREFGCRTVLWSVDSQDYRMPHNGGRTIEAVMKGVHPGGITFLHDILPTTVDAVPAMVRRLKADGWRFLTVSQLMALGKKSAVPAEGGKTGPAGKD